MSELGPGATFHLGIALHWNHPATDLSLLPTSSNIEGFLIDITGQFREENCRQLLGGLIPSLTLPCLRDLTLTKLPDPPRTIHNFPPSPVSWPHTEFLSLAERSSFHAHLLSLDLSHVSITLVELLEFLSVLPSLERLAISEDEYIDYDESLFNNTLLKSLTLTPDSPCPVPRLCILRVRSRLEFDDNIYLQFLLSRLHPRVPFECEIRWFESDYRNHRRDLDPAVLAQINELRATKRLVFSFAALKGH